MRSFDINFALLATPEFSSALVAVGLATLFYRGWTLTSLLANEIEEIISSKKTKEEDESAVQISTLKFLSLNSWCTYTSAPPQKPRLKKLVQYIKETKPDVILLQELFFLRIGPFVYGEDMKEMIRDLQNLGYGYFSHSLKTLTPWWFPLAQNSGLFMASKIPFKIMVEKSFTDTAETSAKGFTVGKFSIHNQEFYVTTTHFSHKKWKIKEAQIKEMTNYLSTLEEKPLIIAGDFNICPEASLKPYVAVENYKNGEISFEYKFLTSKFKNLHIPLQNIFENDETGYSKLEKNKSKIKLESWTFGLLSAKPYAWLPPKKPQAVDHFFISKEIKILNKKRNVILNPKDSISDHLSMEVELQVFSE